MNEPVTHPEILVFGEVNPDIVVTSVPPLSFGQREDTTGPVTMTVGSSVAITACGLARLGTRCALVGVVGDDAFADFMLRRLADRGVGVDRIRTVPGGRTGSSVILVRAQDSGDRQILTDPGVMGELRAHDLDLATADGVRHLHIGSWFLHTGAVADLPKLAAEARRRGMSVSVDPNDDPARGWQSHLGDALPHVTTFFCNESEARGVAGALGGPADATAHDAARHILGHLGSDGTVVLKCGPDGAYAHTAGSVVHVGAPPMDVVDTVGAGDTLAAAFLHARLGGQDVAGALRLAVAAGSLSTLRSGGVEGQPTAREAAALAADLTATKTTPSGGRERLPGGPPENTEDKDHS